MENKKGYRLIFNFLCFSLRILFFTRFRIILTVSSISFTSATRTRNEWRNNRISPADGTVDLYQLLLSVDVTGTTVHGFIVFYRHNPLPSRWIFCPKKKSPAAVRRHRHISNGVQNVRIYYTRIDSDGGTGVKTVTTRVSTYVRTHALYRARVEELRGALLLMRRRGNTIFLSKLSVFPLLRAFGAASVNHRFIGSFPNTASH